MPVSRAATEAVEEIIEYCTGRGCRRKTLISRFGEIMPGIFPFLIALKLVNIRGGFNETHLYRSLVQRGYLGCCDLELRDRDVPLPYANAKSKN